MLGWKIQLWKFGTVQTLLIKNWYVNGSDYYINLEMGDGKFKQVMAFWEGWGTSINSAKSVVDEDDEDDTIIYF
jgi:hypothetical protein